MKRKLVTALPVLGALTLSANAQAGTVNWALGGDGNVSAAGTLTFGPDPNASSTFGTTVTPVSPPPAGYPPVTVYVSGADPLSASLITNVTGVFSDKALGITNVAITGVVPDNFLPHFAPDATIPESFSYDRLGPNPWVSYDDLFYADGSSPQTCTLPPPGDYGGYFDNYGVMFSLANGDLVDLYSNGDTLASGGPPLSPAPYFYGVVVISGGLPDYTSAAGLAFATPEPSTWAMMALGFVGLGFAGYRGSRKSAAAGA